MLQSDVLVIELPPDKGQATALRGTTGTDRSWGEETLLVRISSASGGELAAPLRARGRPSKSAGATA